MKWLFKLTDELANTPTAVTLTVEPEGWADISISITRDKNYRGCFANVSSTLNFAGDGFTLLKNAFEEYATDADVTIEILAACDDCDTFDSFFIGKITFGDIEFAEGHICQAKCGIQEFGALAMMQRRSDQKVDLEAKFAFDNFHKLDKYEGLNIDVTMEPKAIQLSAYSQDAITANQEEDFNMLTAIGAGYELKTSGSYMWGAFAINGNGLNEVLGQNLPGVSQQFQGSTQVLADVPVIFQAEIAATYSFIITIPDLVAGWVELGAFTGTTVQGCAGGGDAFSQYQVKVVLEIGGVAHDIIDSGIVTGCFTTGGLPVYAKATETLHVAMSVGDTARLWIEVHMAGNYLRDATVNKTVQHVHIVHHFSCTLSISEMSWAAHTIASQFMINEVFSRISEVVTNNQMRVKSNYFGRTDSQPYASGSDGAGSLLGLTTGLMLRNAYSKDTMGNYVMPARLQLSFKETFNALNAIHNIGMGIEDDTDRQGQYKRFRIEPIEYFYDDTVIMVCDKIYDVSLSSNFEECFSIFKNGYNKFEAEKYTGLDEFNSTREYRTNLQQINTTLDKTCQFIASGYCIEVTRQMQFNAALAQDWRLDNEVFVVCLKRGHLESGTPSDDGDFNLLSGGIPIPQAISNTINICVEQGDGNNTPPSMAGNLIHPPSIYNMRISPIRNLLRWCKTILQCYTPTQLLSAGFVALHFTKAEGNYFGLGYTHNDYVNWGTMTPKEYSNVTKDLVSLNNDLKPLIKPQVLKFNFPMNLKQFKKVNANPNGTIQCRWGNNTDFVNCYISEIEYYPNKGIARFQLTPKWE